MTWNLETFRSKLKKLNVDRKKNRYSAGKAPHKPVLLLSLFLLDRNDRADLSDIKANLALRETWGDLWRCLEYSKPGPLHLPMYHMKSDGFWEVELRKGVSAHQPKSLGELTSMTSRIAFKPEVIELIDDDRSRNEIINSILHGGYFSDGEIERLREFIESFDQSFEYEHKLNLMVKRDFRMKIEEEFVPKRDPAFRRAVLEAYDERCAVCE
ncbi:MAG: hypothetical protein ACTSRU_18040, partial [Candidatus Hodarchaeales archaeon]